MEKEEMEKLAQGQIEKARLAESLINSKAWQELFEPEILNKKIEFHRNIENCPEGKSEAYKETVKTLKSLKMELEEIIKQAPVAEGVLKELEKQSE